MAEVDVPSWLKSLALAPEYHPTEAEFLDLIDYIFKIEQEASQYGICKIVPPHSKAPKRVVFNNLNLSLANSQDATATGEVPTVGRNMCPARSMSGGNVPASAVRLEVEAGGKAKFTTRRQQLGWNARKVRGGVPHSVVHKLVWQSGETYTLDQFEAKAKIFARNRLGTSQELVPLAVEAHFWKAAFEKPISIEYANDIPGSAFAEPREATLPPKRRGVLDEATTPTEAFGENESGPEEEEKVAFNKDIGISEDELEASKGAGIDADTGRGINCKLSNSAWNMRKVARSPGSLLRFIPDEVPGVTSPMVYIGMLFSWFAWHVEDHELHSLNYLHTGAPKTWYAVPGDAAPALEEVVRVHGYGGQLNAQDAFARLGEKTTVMSPEVLVAAGVPCCRLVQNAGEYVVTFPRAYHLGFSHGFNCGEAANFATPGWLEVAREASVRRAAMNYLPMLSHQQLLYMLAMSLISRSIFDIASEKRSSRLKEKKRVGEEVVKSMFVNDVIQQNDFIGKLLDNGVASCLLVKDSKLYASHAITSMSEWNDSYQACTVDEKNHDEVNSIIDALEIPASENPVDVQVLPSSALVSMAAEVSSVEHKENREPCILNNINCKIEKEQVYGEDLVTSTLPRDLNTMPCAACGILCYTGMAIVRPSQSAAASFRRLRSHASGPGSRRSKGVAIPPSGVLPGKADKKSPDFHMLPNDVQPLPELEGTTPDVFTDAVYVDQTEELEVWTPDLKECPTTYKYSSNDASADIERDINVSSEVVNAISCAENVGLTFNNNAGDAIEVDKQNHDIASGLRSAVSIDPTAQNSNAESTKCSPGRIELKMNAEGMLSSLQLLASTYDDSDADEYDLVEHGDKGNVVGCPPVGPTNHTADFSGLDSENLVPRPASSNLASPPPNTEMNSRSLTSKSLRLDPEPSGINISPPDSQPLALKGTTSCLDELSEKLWKSSTELESCKKSWVAREDSGRAMTELSSFQSNSKSDHDEAMARDEAKRKSALSFGECVTCSLPHDSFFDSFEEVALKNVDNETVGLENSSEKTGILVSCDEKTKPCAIDAPAITLEPIETVGVPGTPTLKVDRQLAEGSSVTTDSPIKVGEALDNIGSLAVAYATHNPNVNEIHGVVQSSQIGSSAPNRLQILKGAARPRVLCLEHAIAAQKRLESIGGGTVILICNFSFLKAERHAKAIAAEVGVQHQWRIVPFQKAGDEDYKVIAAAVEAEQYIPGDSDWVDLLGLSVYGQNSSFSNDVEITNGNPSSVESEELGSRTWRKGRKEKKSSVIRQWCGKGWRVDQLHPLLGGRRNVTALLDNTSAGANLCTSNVVYNYIESGRLRKVMRPARLAEYTTDGHAPKGELHTKKPINKRKILLEMSEDELDDQKSEATPSRLGGSDDGFFAQTTLRGSSEDDLWREVPIASTDSFLLPLQLSDMAAERGQDDFFSFSPQFSSSKDLYLPASLANSSANNVTAHSGGSQSCAVVGGFLQRGAKLQALQKLCRQLSTSEAITVPCTPLTTPSRYASWMNSKSNFHKRISTAKLVNRLKRKPSFDEVSLDVKKQKFVEVNEQKNESLPSSGENSSGHRDNGECFIRKPLTSERNIISPRGDEVIEDLPGSRDVAGEASRGLKPDMSSYHFEITAGDDEPKLKSNEEPREEQNDSDLEPVQDCSSRLLEISTNSSPSKSISQEYLHHRVEGLPQEFNHCSPDRSLLSQTRNIDDPTSFSTSIYCTESLPQGNDEQKIREDLVELSIEESPILVPRRVRGKRTKSRNWKSCIHMTLGSNLPLEEKFVFPIGDDDNHTSDDGSNDPVEVDSKLSSGRCGSGAQADPDFFPHFNCLTSSTATVRRRRICTSGMNSEWGANKCTGNEGEADGSANHPSVHLDTKTTKKRKNGNQKSSATKRCEADLEGEFQCDIEGCIMAFDSVRDLELHKKNRCTWKGCGKHFHMHKYLLQHRRVHLDDRPLKCPWKGCTQSFKWAWARTEHIRVHTGERPYTCMVSGCGQTFRFVSDFSRHKRNTGHRPT
ncbi:uncharacterized protein [Physcomitrium patens]|uniref:Uncharacterized protein n=2 Tax=Physcomitrium patens TaxID=3218 RepID=A0A2K1KB03_PHYPA|nr:uncharacterized protein LOC112284610 isoform X2 [Physcomitrium patens]PNR50955.1 hypothetical protein PHYPA_010141 [Physcomitrium patens]|eukprot:XP_024380326.1 uncharacterized protein LOC112284610 isoform X2 [Physcomitrella patens]